MTERRTETRETSVCPACGAPIFRYVTVRDVKLSPRTTATWWCHEGRHTFACEQPAAKETR